MDLKGFVDRAKDAAAAAAELAREVAAAAAEQAKQAMGPAPEEPEKGTPVPGELASLASAPQPPSAVAGPARGPTPAATARLSELTSLGAEKLRDLMRSFQEALPSIKSAGYELTEFEVELGLTPKLIPHFRHVARSADDIAAARDALRDNRLGAVILGALLKAGDVHRQIQLADFSFSHVEIELGLIPSVRMQYKRE